MVVWIITEGDYYRDQTYIRYIHKTKKSAVLKCKSDNFKFSKKEDYFYNDEISKYRYLEKYNVEE